MILNRTLKVLLIVCSTLATIWLSFVVYDQVDSHFLQPRRERKRAALEDCKEQEKDKRNAEYERGLALARERGLSENEYYLQKLKEAIEMRKRKAAGAVMPAMPNPCAQFED